MIQIFKKKSDSTRDFLPQQIRSYISSHFPFWIQVLAFIALATVIFHFNDFFEWTIFSERDFSRAKNWLEGHFYWPGPEMSGGNNLPGPLFYFLLFPALLIGENTYSQLFLWIIIWSVLTYAVAFIFIAKITSHKESLLIFLLTFISNPSSFIVFSMLNPLFAVLFHVLAVIGLYYWRDRKNNLYLYFTGFVIALGIQVHLLVALHILTVLLFYIIDKSTRNIKALLLFLLLALSPVLIYMLLKSFHVFETSTGFPYTYVHLLIENIFSEKYFRHIIKYIIPFIPFFALCLAFTLYLQYKTKKRIINSSTQNLFLIMLAPFLTAFLVAKQSWYLLFIPILSLILISKWLDDLMPNKATKKINFLLFYTAFIIGSFLIKHNHGFWLLNPLSLLEIEDKLAGFLFFFAIAIFFISLGWQRKYLYRVLLLSLSVLISTQMNLLKAFDRNTYKPPVAKTFAMRQPSYKELYPLMKQIYLETAWPPKTAMKKIYNIGIHLATSLLASYTMTAENLNSGGGGIASYINPKLSLSLYKAQGYFIIQHLTKFDNWTQEDWKNYLSQFLLSPFLQEEIQEGHIIIKAPKLYGQFWLIPYNITENSSFPEGFHNIGQPYYYEEPEWLKRCDKTQSFKNEKGFFYCQILPGHLQRAGLSITLPEKDNKAPFLNIHFSGPLLSSFQSSNLDGNSKWHDIQIHLNCEKRSFHWTLPDIGVYNWRTVHSPEKMAKAFLAPLELRLPIKGCKKKDIKKITVTFKEDYLETIMDILVIWELD